MNLGSLGRLPCSPFPPCSPACSSGPRSNLPPAFRGPRARPHLALLIRPAGLCFLITTLMPPMVPLTGGLNSLLESIMGLSEVQRSNQDKGDPRLQSMLPRGVSPVPTGAEPGGRRGCSWARRVPIGAGGQQWSSQGEGSSQARSAQLLRPDAGGGAFRTQPGCQSPIQHSWPVAPWACTYPASRSWGMPAPEGRQGSWTRVYLPESSEVDGFKSGRGRSDLGAGPHLSSAARSRGSPQTHDGDTSTKSSFWTLNQTSIAGPF